MNRPDYSNPFAIVALGVACGPVLWGIAQVLPALATAAGILISAVAASAGLAFAVATTGFASAGSVVSWLPTAATVGVVTAGIGTTYLILEKIIEKGKEKPYEWLLPALTPLAVFFVDLTKDQLLPTVTERAIYALSTGIFTVGGGLLLMQRRIAVRAIGFILPFFPSVTVCLLLLHQEHISGALTDFIASGSIGAAGLVSAFVLASVIAILGILLPTND